MKTLREELDDLYLLASLDENVYIMRKIEKIRSVLLCAESTPNDAELGAKIRELL